MTQAGVTGHEAISNRSGTAIGFYGTGVGGAYINRHFSYAFAVGIDAQIQGLYNISDAWIDGTTYTNGKPLQPSSIGIRFGDVSYIAPQTSNLRVCCQGSAVVIGNSTAGTYPFSNVDLWANNVGFSVMGNNLQVTNFSIRGYDAGFIFGNAAAANTAKLVNGLLFDRNTTASDPIDINAGTGDPTLIGVSRSGAPLDMRNEGRTTLAPDGSGLLAIPNGKTWVTVTGTQPIASISPAYDGAAVTLEFAQAGNAFSGGAFLLSTGFTSTKSGSNITLRFSRRLGQWVEVSRGPV